MIKITYILFIEYLERLQFWVRPRWRKFRTETCHTAGLMILEMSVLQLTSLFLRYFWLAIRSHKSLNYHYGWSNYHLIWLAHHKLVFFWPIKPTLGYIELHFTTKWKRSIQDQAWAHPEGTNKLDLQWHRFSGCLLLLYILLSFNSHLLANLLRENFFGFSDASAWYTDTIWNNKWFRL